MDESNVSIAPLSTIVVPGPQRAITLQVLLLRFLNPHTGRWHEVMIVKRG